MKQFHQNFSEFVQLAFCRILVLLWDQMSISWHHFIHHLMFLPHSSHSYFSPLTFLDVWINSKAIILLSSNLKVVTITLSPNSVTWLSLLLIPRNALLDFALASWIYFRDLSNSWSQTALYESVSWVMGPGGGIWVTDTLKCVVWSIMCSATGPEQ